MTFRVLRASGADLRCWLAVLDGFPPELRDLHYTPEYGRVYADTYGYEPMLAVLEVAQGSVIHAFVGRSLNGLPFLAQDGNHGPVTDVATPYGFGGPLLFHRQQGDGSALLHAFDRHWRDWCFTERIPAEFVCLHPVLANAAAVAASGIAAPTAAKEVVIIDLAKSAETLWSEVSRGTRSSIQRARREGIAVERMEPTPAALDAFRSLYLATMQRVGAAQRWMFPPAYFPACIERLGSEGSALFFARRHKELAAAYLLIRDRRTAYYHFGASDERFLALRPNNLLMYETLLWAKGAGCVQYHLGGGVTTERNDSLLRFKSSFGGSKVLLYTYGRVHHADVYRDLCEQKVGYEKRHGGSVSAPDFFPLYRR